MSERDHPRTLPSPYAAHPSQRYDTSLFVTRPGDLDDGSPGSPWPQDRRARLDGYKANVAVDPNSVVICAAEVSPATSGDAVVAPTLLDDLVSD
jgi:hypothetical protein